MQFSLRLKKNTHLPLIIVWSVVTAIIKVYFHFINQLRNLRELPLSREKIDFTTEFRKMALFFDGQKKRKTVK